MFTERSHTYHSIVNAPLLIFLLLSSDSLEYLVDCGTQESGFRSSVSRFSALFMALHQDLTNNLFPTTIAVVLFVLVCSIPLKLTSDQIFVSTFGYAAVLMVFVGLTSSPRPATSVRIGRVGSQSQFSFAI
jgi:hypothetical protein